MSYINELKEICRKYGSRITENCDLSEYVTFRFGGPCCALISINSAEAAAELIKFLHSRDIKYAVLGRGSNIIVADEGFDGVVLCLSGGDFANTEISGNTIKCDAGALLASVCVLAQNNSLTGMENLYGIPGTIGGALYMNAGAYGSEMKDIVVSAEYIDAQGQLHIINTDKMELSYRHSIFSGTDKIITSVTISLKNGNSEEIRAAMQDCMRKRISKQPLEFPSAGSTFKRPEGSYASMLIDQCGLKGMSVGGAEVSRKHSGFVINKGGATCKDVLDLCKKVREIVLEKTGYLLELEPIILK